MGCGGSKNEAVVDPVQNLSIHGNGSIAKGTENQKSKGPKNLENVSGNKQDNKKKYEKIDAHARKAPPSLKNSIEDLVNYMSSFSKEPRILARGLFVWISENIRYDVDGFFGRAPKASCDALSVMQGGTSVCAGYANVMETLCRQANIPVKNISGYAKGVSYSAAKPFSLEHKTNHAWNAIQLDGKWHLLDCTWGAGHLDSSNAFRKEFNEFYFLTDPAHFVHSHFPYMDRNLTESMKWQLLENPISLEEFNNNVEYKPAAFELGLEAASHPHGFIQMQDEIEMIFKSTKVKDVIVSARLMLQEGNWLKEQLNATFGVPGHDKGTYKLLVHPPKVGMYTMNVFCKKDSDEKHEGSTSAVNYVINCTDVKEKDFEYPMFFGTAWSEKAILHEPLRGKLPQNTMFHFKITAPYLQHMKVGKTFLDKTGDTFTGEINTGSGGEELKVSGTREEQYSTYWGLFKFTII